MRKCEGPKIVMVGGGSYGWSPKLLSDLVQTPELEGSEVVLLDPDTKAAGEIEAVGRALAAGQGKAFSFRATRSETAAFRGADFVIITISTGGLRAMAHDLAVPERYGIYQTVGDTVGPGGWSRSLRNVPVFVHLAQRIEKLAPRAVVLNYTNPMASLTGTIAAVSSLRVVGLCHGVFGTYRLLQQVLGVKESDIAMRFAGVNHFFWVLDFTVKGKPGYPRLRRKLGTKTLEDVLRARDTDGHGHSSGRRLCSALYEQYGHLTYPADRHTCEFLPGYITPTPEALRRFGLHRTSVATRTENRKRARRRALRMASGKLGVLPRSRETAIDMMVALRQNRPFVDVVNLPNVGQVDNLPRGAVVETLGLVDQLGFRAISAGTVPTNLAELVRPHCVCQQMVLQAALEGDKELALQALMLDPVCAHLAPSDIRKMGADLLRATRRWLPQFK